MEGYKRRTIPCSILDTYNMERFLEQQAREGYVLDTYKWLFMDSIFQEMVEDEYCFHIDLYHRNLKNEDSDSGEFKEYLDRFEACGWTMRCYYANLVFFCSRGSDRPSLPVNTQGDPPALIKDITLKTARRHMLVHSGWLLALVALLAGLMLWAGDSSAVVDPAIIIPSIWILSILLSNIFLYIAIAYRVKRLLSPSEVRLFWNEGFLLQLEFMALSALIIVCCWENRTLRLVLPGISLILCAAAFCGYWMWKCRYSKSPWKKSWQEIAGYILSCLLMIALLVNIPTSGIYRYGLSSGKSYYGINEEIPNADMGLTQPELGWGQSDRIFTHVNSNHLCQWEWIIYSEDSVQELFSHGRPDYLRDSRYVGTIVAILKDSDQASAYLKQKKLDPASSTPAEISPEFTSYISGSRKEIYHIKGNLIIVHFLNTYDPRTFDIEQEIAGKALKDNLDTITKKAEDISLNKDSLD